MLICLAAAMPPVLQDNVVCHLASSLCAGFLAVMVGSPADVIKSRMMGEAGEILFQGTPIKGDFL